MIAATACITACYMLLAWQYRSPQRTWAGSIVAMAGLIHGGWFGTIPMWSSSRG